MPSYSQYSEHRRPEAVPKVRRAEHQDATGEDVLKLQRSFEQAIEKASGKAAGKAAPKRSFAELIKKKK